MRRTPRPASSSRIRVLESFGQPRPTTNPYIVQLGRALAGHPEVDLLFFSWRAAILGRYDVFHVHWPEIMFEGRRRRSRIARRLLTVALCVRLALGRIPVVRTWHNLERPSGLGYLDHRLLDALDRLTALRIRLNSSGPMPPDTPFVTILHGHYRDWFREYPRPEATPGRMLFVGLIRRYKGVEHLIEAFRAVGDQALLLHVAGHPSTPELAETIRGLADPDPRVSVHLSFLDDPAYVRAVCESHVVVLPYRHMHNSGSVLAALSLDRPVLVPDNEVNRLLADEVGADWVHFYGDDLSPDDLAAAVASGPVPGSPDLSAREWATTASEHVAAIRRAIAPS